ncbi:hypothetical protein [Escherichia coli]
MMSLWDALRMNMMISYQELVRTFPKMVVAEGRQLSDVTPGEFLSPATFTISYQ